MAENNNECQGEFNAPPTPTSKCYQCGERLKDHSFYDKWKKQVPSE